jgi:hypothetical protein
MATEIKTWEIINDELVEIDVSLCDKDKKEKDHLEKWIKTNPKILGDDILIIGEQVYTRSGPLDFLGVDNSGNAVIVELKRDKLPRECLAQAIDYASDVATWDIDRLSEICMQYRGQPLYDFISDNFVGVEVDEFVINKAQRLLLVGFLIEEPLTRMIKWLSEYYDIGINAIILKYVHTTSGNELIAKTAIISEEIEREKSDKRRFKIAMSDEPGSYTVEDLKELLMKYLGGNLWSAKRMKNVMLPLLQRNKKVTREELKREFVRLDEAKDEAQAGQFISLISNQLGQKAKDYLRQLISYEYPNYSWEKDNFIINEEYRGLLEEILNELNANS